MRQTTCFFTGHKKLPVKKISRIITHLNAEIDRLIQVGVLNFISGGSLGFDQIAASFIVTKKELGANIRLILALPYRNQDEHWTARQKQLYNFLLSEADEIRYISDQYNYDCIKKRNHYMVDNSDYCICALIRCMSETEQTVRYAKAKGVHIINVAQ